MDRLKPRGSELPAEVSCTDPDENTFEHLVQLLKYQEMELQRISKVLAGGRRSPWPACIFQEAELRGPDRGEVTCQ